MDKKWLGSMQHSFYNSLEDVQKFESPKREEKEISFFKEKEE